MKIDTNQLPIFFVAVDKHCRVIEWNLTVTEITGRARADALDKDVEDCLNILTNPTAVTTPFKGIKSTISNVFHNEPLLKQEFRVQALGDSHYELLLNFSALHDEHGSLLGALIVGQDIKEQKPFERNRVADGQHIRNFFEHSTVLMVGMDSCGLIKTWNIQMFEVTGFSKEESVGKNFVQVGRIPLS